MRTDGEPSAFRDFLSPTIIGAAAVLLGLIRETTQIRPAILLERFAAAHARWHPGMLLFCCGMALIAWSAAMSRRHTRKRAAGTAQVALAQTGAVASGRAARDPLCSPAARARFAEALAASAPGPAPAAVLVIDIDGLRGLVRSHGAAGADELLRQFGGRLVEIAPEGAVLACLEADEFVVLLPATGVAAVRLAAAEMQKRLSGGYGFGGGTAELAASIGAAVGPAQGNTADSLLHAARQALTWAKTGGGCGWRLFDAAVCEAAQARAALQTELRPALRAGEFVPYYQPIVSLATGDIVGMEVLARWHHKRRGLLSPHDFISLMEAQLLCAELSLCLLRQVMVDARTWPKSWSFAFNASPCQLRDMPDFISEVEQSPDCGIHPSRIELEVTETVLIEDMALARQVVQAMHRAGAKVVLDDFGTGYANLLPLRDLPFDRIKIDRGFVRDMLLSARTDACMRAMIGLARSLGTSMIAEGVESEAAERRLRDMGCEFAQGYYYSPPVPAEGVPLLVRRAELRKQGRAVAA